MNMTTVIPGLQKKRDFADCDDLLEEPCMKIQVFLWLENPYVMRAKQKRNIIASLKTRVIQTSGVLRMACCNTQA